MNDLIENLDQLVLENKLSRASQEIKKYLSQDTKLTQKLFETIQKVFELIDQKDISSIRNFLELGLNNNLYIKNYLEKILRKTNELEFYYIYPIAKEYFISNGMLIDFENIFKRFKKNLLINKAYTHLIEEVKKLQNLGIEIEIRPEELFLAHYGQGDIKYFEQEYQNALSENKKSFLHEIIVNFDDPIWRKQSFVMKETIIRNAGSSSVEQKKEFLKAIYELLLVDNEMESCLLLLLEYSVEMGHRGLAEAIIEINVSMFNAKKEDLESKLIKMKEVARGSFEDIDLAEDLFSEEVEDQDKTIQRLVNQINILRNERDLEGATKLLKKLKELDRDHSLVKELEEKEHRIKGSKRSQVNRTLSEIENDLMNELSIYCENEKVEVKEEEDYLKIYTKKTVDMMTIENLLVQYRELIYSYNSLGFYESSLRVIERILNEGDLALKEEIDVLYLNVEILRMCQNYYGALNLIEKIIDEKAMTDNERVSFYYLKGEVLRELGRRRDALKEYAKVFSINKKYRMVSYRLKEIE